MSSIQRLFSLPVHPAPGRETERYALRVDGLVKAPLVLGLDDLLALPQVSLRDDFACLEGWVVPELDWRGVRLSTVLNLAAPLPGAAWVQASFEEFSIPLSIERAADSLLALTLNGAPLAVEHGAPVRLLVPGGECFTSVKWLDHLELRAEPAPNRAKEIALKRIGR
ncbi:MAG: molybdopterin-dependent oxidoreductase [Dehalococcoidia bacterium]|jgi:DMSO/TMAO reductase YedYZ molybdopterin-dependent catalytic subunit